MILDYYNVYSVVLMIMKISAKSVTDLNLKTVNNVKKDTTLIPQTINVKPVLMDVKSAEVIIHVMFVKKVLSEL